MVPTEQERKERVIVDDVKCKVTISDRGEEKILDPKE